MHTPGDENPAKRLNVMSLGQTRKALPRPSLPPMASPPAGAPLAATRSAATVGPAAADRPETSLTLGADRSPIPLYHRLYVILRERIVNGTYRVGQTLPAEADLMARFGVSRITAKRAVDELSAEGLVARMRGRGTTVTRAGALMSGGGPIAAGIDGLLANLSLIGKETSVELVEFDYVPAAEMVADELGIEPATPVQRAVRIRHLDGRPFSMSTSFVIEGIGRTFGRDDLTRTPLIDLLARAGVIVGRVDQAITSTLADDTTAARLATSVGSPLLKLRRVFFDQDDRRVDYVEMLYRPDRFEYRMTLSRNGENRFELDRGGR